MSKQDRQKLSVFVVLVGVLGLTLVLGYRMNQPATTSAVQIPETKPASKPLTASDARIRLDLVENPEKGDQIGERNVFQYRQARPAQTGRPNAPGSGSPSEVPSNTPPPIVPAVPAGPPGPPAPPPMPFKYTGFAIMNSSLTAFLSDDAARQHYNVTAGEVLMGRYRITQITDTTVEVEDLQFNRRQVLPLQK